MRMAGTLLRHTFIDTELQNQQHRCTEFSRLARNWLIFWCADEYGIQPVLGFAWWASKPADAPDASMMDSHRCASMINPHKTDSQGQNGCSRLDHVT